MWTYSTPLLRGLSLRHIHYPLGVQILLDRWASGLTLANDYDVKRPTVLNEREETTSDDEIGNEFQILLRI